MNNRLLLIISVYLASIATPSFALRPEGTQLSTSSATEENVVIAKPESTAPTSTSTAKDANKSETAAKTETTKSENAASPSSESSSSKSSDSSKSNTAKTEEVVAPKTESASPAKSESSSNSSSKTETPAATPVSAVKTETATPKTETPTITNTSPKVETPAATPASAVKTETATPKTETPAVTNTSPEVETPATTNSTSVSAPSISLSAPAPNPVYIAPKTEASTTKTDSTDVKKEVAAQDDKKNVKTDDKTVLESAKDKVMSTDNTIFMTKDDFVAKDDTAKTCPNTPAIIDIGSNDEIVGTGSYRTTFKTNNGSSVTNNWDGWNGKDGTVTYVPGKDFRGLDSFTYTIRAQNGKTSVATVSVNVSCDEAGFSRVSSCNAYAISDDYSLMPVVVHRTQLLKIAQDSGQVTAIGEPLPPKQGIEGLAISPITHTMYAVSGGYAAKSLNGNLYRVNSNTGEIQWVGDTGFKGTSSLAFRNDGSLWAWSNSGLIAIDPSTAQASLVFSSNKDFEGLAWSSDGKTLYASKFTSLWAYDGSDVKRICNNFPDEVESLETLSNGLLMYSLSQQRVDATGNALYIYDPKQCKLISSMPVGEYRDIESVAWAYDCQNHTASTSGSIKFEGATETQMCLEPSQWLEVKGTVALQPTTASAQLQTIWQVIEPPQPECPNGECKQAQVKTQVVTGETPFYIKGWWDGLKKQSAVKLRYTARLLDMQGQALAGSPEVSKTLVATKEACGKADSSLPAGAVGQAAADANALQSYFKEMGLKQFSIDEHGKLSVTFDGKTHYGMFSYVIEQGSANADQKLTLKAIPDANADGVDDFVVIYPNGQTQLLLYLGNQ